MGKNKLTENVWRIKTNIKENSKLSCGRVRYPNIRKISSLDVEELRILR